MAATPFVDFIPLDRRPVSISGTSCIRFGDNDVLDGTEGHEYAISSAFHWTPPLTGPIYVRIDAMSGSCTVSMWWPPIPECLRTGTHKTDSEES